ncbi:hypothetical protein EJ08DRAFT_653250 [Tothia fuscella]|uniref:Uncharacterized protein n=1 Tax=Tothia fuscella TaxID=1048955 RepID=A0A9P4TTA7_9PEZI|nr:hypothetical protein EJ08DRAFT_653250 [Tothia fuscella]
MATEPVNATNGALSLTAGPEKQSLPAPVNIAETEEQSFPALVNIAEIEEEQSLPAPVNTAETEEEPFLDPVNTVEPTLARPVSASSDLSVLSSSIVTSDDRKSGI